LKVERPQRPTVGVERERVDAEQRRGGRDRPDCVAADGRGRCARDEEGGARLQHANDSRIAGICDENDAVAADNDGRGGRERAA